MTLLEEKKSFREMRRVKISCKAFIREKKSCPPDCCKKKFLMTRNHPHPPSRVKWSAPYYDLLNKIQWNLDLTRCHGLAKFVR